MDLESALALERRVWDALVAGDQAADRAVLSDDFLGVYDSGYAGADCHSGQLADGPSMASYRIEDPRLVTLADDTVLLAYLAHYTATADPEQPKAMYVSSIWQHRNGTWLNTFSQDTATKV